MSEVGLVLGLAAALVYGAADLSGGLASRRSPALTVVTGAYFVSLPMLVIAAIVDGGGPPAPEQLAWAVVGGGAEVVATLALYLALAAGAMNLVSPFVGVVGAAVPLLVGLAIGEPLPAVQAVGMALAFAAIVVVARPARTGRTSRRALGLALIAGLAYATSYVAFSGAQSIAGGAGAWTMALVARLVGLAVVLGATAMARRPLVAARVDRPWVVAAGLLDAIALACLLAAYGAGPLGLTTVVASLYPAVTAVLAAALLKERLGRVELTGVACAIAAVACMGLA
jgi:drug/metabolite transporter (DMT)-like permease